MGAPEFIAPPALSSADSLLQGQWVRERLDAASSSDAFARAQLRLALQEQRLRVAYQPILRLDDLQTMGQEALARMLTPQGRVVTAEAFIGTAAKLGIEPRIDAAITAQAMAAASQPRPFAAAPRKLFLNCSSAFLAEASCMDKLAQQHRHWLQKWSGADTNQTPWVLEITERNLNTDPARLLANLKPLLDLGFELALDDFGSNHSAFPYLLALPIRYLKLDRGLVQTGMRTAKGEHVLRHLLQLAQDLNLITIAEGVENQTALQWLRGIGVHWGQGFFWGQPTSMQAAQ
jgi:EAL domain-containing protein (putative c-di-GMP-specific phosphodiesterase class I)